MLGLVLTWLSELPMQLIYVLLITALCGYHCWRHYRYRPRFSYFTNGFIQLQEGGELLLLSPHSRTADLFIVLSYARAVTPRQRRSLYIMRDAITDSDYRRLVRTVKMLRG